MKENHTKTPTHQNVSIGFNKNYKTTLLKNAIEQNNLSINFIREQMLVIFLAIAGGGLVILLSYFSEEKSISLVPVFVLISVLSFFFAIYRLLLYIRFLSCEASECLVHTNRVCYQLLENPNDDYDNNIYGNLIEKSDTINKKALKHITWIYYSICAGLMPCLIVILILLYTDIIRMIH